MNGTHFLCILVVLIVVLVGAIERLIVARGDRKLTKHLFDQKSVHVRAHSVGRPGEGRGGAEAARAVPIDATAARSGNAIAGIFKTVGSPARGSLSRRYNPGHDKGRGPMRREASRATAVGSNMR